MVAAREIRDSFLDPNGTDLSEIHDDLTGLDAGNESQQSEDSRQSEAMSCLLTGCRIPWASSFALR